MNEADEIQTLTALVQTALSRSETGGQLGRIQHQHPTLASVVLDLPTRRASFYSAEHGPHLVWIASDGTGYGPALLQGLLRHAQATAVPEPLVNHAAAAREARGAAPNSAAAPEVPVRDQAPVVRPPLGRTLSLHWPPLRFALLGTLAVLLTVLGPVSAALGMILMSLEWSHVGLRRINEPLRPRHYVPVDAAAAALSLTLALLAPALWTAAVYIGMTVLVASALRRKFRRRPPIPDQAAPAPADRAPAQAALPGPGQTLTAAEQALLRQTRDVLTAALAENERLQDARRIYEAKTALDTTLPETVRAYEALPRHRRDARTFAETLRLIPEPAQPDHAPDVARWDQQVRYVKDKAGADTPKDLKVGKG